MIYHVYDNATAGWRRKFNEISYIDQLCRPNSTQPDLRIASRCLQLGVNVYIRNDIAAATIVN